MINTKVGIVTIYKNNQNYGGLLQAFGLQKYIESVGFDCELISYERNPQAYRKARFRNLGFFRSLELLANKVKTKAIAYVKSDYRQGLAARSRRFKAFENEIKHSVAVHDNSISSQCDTYQAMICGSDQIWNPGLWNDVMFLNIQGFEGKKIAYAASIGRKSLTNAEQQYMAKNLCALDAISVREESAAQIVRQLTPKKVTTVLDPTFLLSAEQWHGFARRPIGCPDQFVFSFFLGRNTEAKMAVAEMYKGKVPIVTLPHLQTGYKREDETYSDIQLYDVGPHEWVWLIQNAKYVFTDSFHGTAFSINLGTAFCSFPKGRKNDKQSINSRLQDILIEFGLDGRFIEDVGTMEKVLVQPIDQEDVQKRLEARLTVSRYFLGDALM